MPATTPCRSYPYPLDSDPIDVAGDIGDLARAVDTDTCQLNSNVTNLTTRMGSAEGRLGVVEGRVNNIYVAPPINGFCEYNPGPVGVGVGTLSINNIQGSGLFTQTGPNTFVLTRNATVSGTLQFIWDSPTSGVCIIALLINNAVAYVDKAVSGTGFFRAGETAGTISFSRWFAAGAQFTVDIERTGSGGNVQRCFLEMIEVRPST